MATLQQKILVEELLDKLGWSRKDMAANGIFGYEDYENLHEVYVDELIDGLRVRLKRKEASKGRA